MSPIVTTILASATLLGHQSQPAASFSFLDVNELKLFERFLETKKVESGFVHAGGWLGLYIFGIKDTGVIQKLKNEYRERFGIDVDRLDSDGRIIRPFKRHALKFAPPVDPKYLSRTTKPHYLAAAIRDTVGKRNGILVHEVIYLERPWISERGRFCRALQGIVKGKQGRYSWSRSFEYEILEDQRIPQKANL